MDSVKYTLIDDFCSIELRDCEEVAGAFAEYFSLLRQWNEHVRLVSRQDLECLDDHVLDSLCMAPYLVADWVETPRVLDIGSGGGFPGIPLAVCCPGMDLVLLERSERKVAFLKHVVQRLELSGVVVRCGGFPEAVVGEDFDFVTARAVERPEMLIEGISELIRGGARLLCQSERLLDGFEEGFVVERVEDGLDQAGFRRGRLDLVDFRVIEGG